MIDVSYSDRLDRLRLFVRVDLLGWDVNYGFGIVGQLFMAVPENGSKVTRRRGRV